jgi:formate-dependent nitrite reductase membrane component NrfD
MSGEHEMTGVPQDTAAPPDRDAITGDVEKAPRIGRRRGRREKAMVPDAHFESYYGKPVLNKPTWESRDIAGYLFLGGLAGGSSILAAGADLTGRRRLARRCKIGALVAISGSLAALIHDLGRPARFINMLRVFKPSSPMSVGSWILSVYGPQAGIAAATDVFSVLPRIGRVATIGAALVGPAVASYTAALLSDTAVPTWHDDQRHMPFVFVGSAATAAGGLGLLATPLSEARPARRLVILGVATELAASQLMSRRMGITAEPLHRGKAGQLMNAAKALSLGAAVLSATLGRQSRVAAVLGGAAALAGSACTRFGIFHAGVASSEDPKYTVVPQRERAGLNGSFAPR